MSVYKTLPGVPLLILGGMTGSATYVGLALAASSAINSAVDLGVTSRVMKIPLREVALACLPSIIASATMGVTLLGFLRWTAHTRPIFQLSGGVLLGATVYAAVLILVDRDFFTRARDHFFHRGIALQDPVESRS
jgi:hypothetical protein